MTTTTRSQPRMLLRMRRRGIHRRLRRRLLSRPLPHSSTREWRGSPRCRRTRWISIANQTTEAIGAWKQAFAVPPSAPGMFLLDLADQGIEKMAQTQKGMIDLVVQQSAQALDLAKERRDSTSKWTTGVADMMSEAADTYCCSAQDSAGFCRRAK